jgi:hypothetical protein
MLRKSLSLSLQHHRNRESHYDNVASPGSRPRQECTIPTASMAGPAAHAPHFNDSDNETDYGSDFSPEEQLIVEQLLAIETSAVVEAEDNPITNDVEFVPLPYTGPILRVLGREVRIEKTYEERAVERQRLEVEFDAGYPDCESPLLLIQTHLTETEAFSDECTAAGA